MSSSFGKNIKVSIFGQSHSKAIGVVIDGIPAGEKIDTEKINNFMKRRAPGQNSYSTPRKEDDLPIILSGIVDNVTCGAPICAIIENKNTISKDYNNLKDVPRPGHADFTSFIKHGSARDLRGGGHFSGRLTAPLCFAGGVAIQILKRHGISIVGHVSSIGNIKDTPFNPVNPQFLEPDSFPTISKNAGAKMIKLIEEMRDIGDSVGGTIECAIVGIKAGFGDPIFDGIENKLAAAIFGIPGIKGIEFGAGFGVSTMRGSENNDAFYVDNSKTVQTKTNNHGGILGGITSGMPIIFKVALKPTSSISIPQESVSLSECCNTSLTVEGRHDPCIVPRALPAVEAIAALSMLDIITT